MDLTRYPETMPTGTLAQMALVDMDLAAVTPGTDVRLVDGVPVTIQGDFEVSDGEIRTAIADVQFLMQPPAPAETERLAA